MTDQEAEDEATRSWQARAEEAEQGLRRARAAYDALREALETEHGEVLRLQAEIEHIKQAANDACQSVYEEWRAGAVFENMPLAIAARMALAWRGTPRVSEETAPLGHCPRCARLLNNISPGISVVAGGVSVCTSCLNPGEHEVARAR